MAPRRPDKPTRKSQAQRTKARIEIRRRVEQIPANRQIDLERAREIANQRDRQIDLSMRATKIHLALEEIDAALLSGDDFEDPQARAELPAKLDTRVG